MLQCITADWHIGCLNDSYIDENGHEFKINETFKQIDNIITYVVKNDIKWMFVVGDIYNSKRPSPLYEKLLINRLNYLEENEINTRLILGNHSFSNSSSHALAPIKEINYKYIKVVDDISFDIINDVHYIYVPHSLLNEEEIKEKIHLSMMDKKCVILGHLQFSGCVVGSESFLLEGGINLFPDIDYRNIKKIFLGHIHKHQILKYKDVEVIYTGSIVRCDFGERKEDKGFVIYDDENQEWEFKKLNTVEYQQVNIDLVNKSHFDIDEDKIKKACNDKIVKIVVSVSEENKRGIDLNEIKNVFSKYCYVSKFEVNTEKREKKDNNKIDLSPKKIFFEYVSNNIQKDIVKDTLINGNEIIDEVMNDNS